jgi:hypothetical protein
VTFSQTYKIWEKVQANFLVRRSIHDQAGADRWFAEYEPGADQYGEHGQLTGNIQGFETPKEARRDCEENASVMAKALSS